MNDISCLTISDIHLGNGRNKTAEIIRNLDSFFSDYTSKSQFCNLDIIFLAGDIFDTLLDSSNDDIRYIELWFGRLMTFCSRFDIKLRILEGTPSHDWKQSKNAETVFKLIDKSLDFIYIDTLHIEYLKDYDAYVLYVPDEWTASADLTLSQVKTLLKEQNIQQVDIAVMHGCFRYQLPPAAKNVPYHDEASYLSIVKHFITIGHIHVHSVYERILAQGSFDRISHNEESPKGAIVFHISEKNGNSFFFIENKGAKIFKTITLKYKDLDRSMLQIDKAVKDIPDNSYVRIKATKDHPLYVAFDDLKLLFPMLTFTKANIEDEEQENLIAQRTLSLEKNYVPITITRDNVVSLIMQEVKPKYNLPPEKLELLQSLLVNNNA
jgi:DNA repair exonuclease SbcCD nuclease subunit